MIKIFKFGGTSIKDAENIKKVVQILRKYANEVLKQKKKRDSRGIMTNLAMVKKIADSAIKSMSNKSKVLKNLYMESSL